MSHSLYMQMQEDEECAGHRGLLCAFCSQLQRTRKASYGSHEVFFLTETQNRGNMTTEKSSSNSRREYKSRLLSFIRITTLSGCCLRMRANMELVVSCYRLKYCQMARDKSRLLLSAPRSFLLRRASGPLLSRRGLEYFTA